VQLVHDAGLFEGELSFLGHSLLYLPIARTVARNYPLLMTILGEKSGCEIHFYGERGLVNGLFLDLRETRRILDLLRKIQFTHREPPHLDPETEVLVIVEAGFAEFGCPDAILVARTPDQKRLVFFVEAKAGRYEEEAQDYRQRDPGFNSTINGQFSLRYRLAHALRGFGDGQSRLVEPKALATAYGEPNPRRLSKPGNLKHIVRPHLARASDYFFVALTDDKTNVWPAIETKKQELLPFLADESAQATTAWALERNRWFRYRADFGWIGFCDIGPLVEDGPYFRYARQFLDDKRSSVTPARPTEAGYVIQTKPWEYFSDRTIRLRDRLRLEIKQSTPVREGQLRYAEEKGSDSVIDVRNQRVLKLITPVPPYDDFDILFGVSVETAGFTEEWHSKSRGGVCVQNRGFEIIGINEVDLTADLAELVRETLANIIEPAD
jgi:hypothetical protein